MNPPPPLLPPGQVLLPTTSDSQCVYKWMSTGGRQECGTNPETVYDPSTCKFYKGRCYSTTAKQCTRSSECGVSWTGECVNKKGGSSLKCRHGGLLGTCVCTDKTPTVSDWFKGGSILKDYNGK